MPTIRRQPERSLLDRTNPQLESVEQAGYRGRAISQFGKDLSGFGSDLAKYQKMKDNLDKTTFDKSAQNAGDMAAQDVLLQLSSSNEVAPDPKSYAQEYDRLVDESMSNYLESLPEDRRPRAGDVFKSQAINKRDDAIVEGRRRHLEYLKDSVDEQLSFSTLKILKNPDNAFEVEADHLIYLESMSDVLGVDKKKIVEEHQRQILDVRVKGYTDPARKQYDKAKDALSDPTTSFFLSSEDRQKKLDNVDKEKLSNAREALGLESAENKLIELRRKTIAEQEMFKLIKNLNEAKTIDEQKAIYDKAEDLAALQIFNVNDLARIKTPTNVAIGNLSNQTEGVLYQKLLNGEDISNDVTSGINKNLTIEAAHRLSTAQQVRKRRLSADPLMKRRWKASDELIREMFDSPVGFPLPNKGAVIQRQTELVANGSDPYTAAKQAVMEFTKIGDLPRTKTYKVPQETSVDIIESMKKIENDFKSIKSPSQKEIDDTKVDMEILLQKKKMLERLEGLKNEQ